MLILSRSFAIGSDEDAETAIAHSISALDSEIVTEVFLFALFRSMILSPKRDLFEDISREMPYFLVLVHSFRWSWFHDIRPPPPAPHCLFPPKKVIIFNLVILLDFLLVFLLLISFVSLKVHKRVKTKGVSRERKGKDVPHPPSLALSCSVTCGVVRQVVLDAATPLERQSAEIKTLKMEAYAHQREMIADEQARQNSLLLRLCECVWYLKPHICSVFCSFHFFHFFCAGRFLWTSIVWRFLMS